ncbi:MAG: aminotransferase class IV [Planctomycetes bacterium]|nr:aminotransferase class IV [Planctomycetota bacterium]
MRWIDGQFVGGSDVVQPGAVVAPFETMGARAGVLPLWEHHLRRLGAACARLRIPFAPPPTLVAAAAELLARNGHDDDVLRLHVIPGSATPSVVMTTRARGPQRTVQLLPCITRRPDDAPPADLKATPRTFYDAVLREAQDGGADDGIVLADDGALLETAIGNLWLLLDGAWTTPPLDGRTLPGIARGLLLTAMTAAGERVAERRCDLADLHRATALAVSSAVHGPRAAGLLGQRPVGKPDTALHRVWQRALRR